MKIKVYVTRVSNRPNYHLQWDDPMTQRQRRQATDVPASNLSRDRKAAERLAAQLEVELNNGSAAIPSKFKWADFRDRYESLILPGLARQTRVKVRVVLDRVGERPPPPWGPRSGSRRSGPDQPLLAIRRRALLTALASALACRSSTR